MNSSDGIHRQLVLPCFSDHTESPACPYVHWRQDKRLRIFTLGRFSVVVDSRPLHYGRKAPHKALTLLKALIATGSREVSAAQLATMVWPDKEGDRAMQAFDTTLLRLRRLLGDGNLLRLQDGRLSLDSQTCWVDTWDFERHMNAVHALLARKPQGRELKDVAMHSRRILAIYQGHFLGHDEATCWSVSTRERLRGKCTHHLLEVGRLWEQQGHWSEAMRCYRKGIDTDELIETFYQRLMVCLMATGRATEAMAVYRQCRQILSIILGLPPTTQTESIYQSIRQTIMPATTRTA